MDGKEQSKGEQNICKWSEQELNGKKYIVFSDNGQYFKPTVNMFFKCTDTQICLMDACLL